jgi:hypothetical protein
MLKIGQTVFWKWGNGFAEAEIQAIHYSTTDIETKGKTIVRHGSENNPALILKNKKGVLILKLASEVKEVKE